MAEGKIRRFVRRMKDRIALTDKHTFILYSILRFLVLLTLIRCNMTARWEGVALGILCTVHLVLNLSMLSGLARTQRRGRLALDILLIAWLVLEVLSGLGMSLYVTPWLMLPDSFLLSRSTHALLGYWGFVLAAIHAGFHAPAIRGQLARHLFKRPAKRRNPLFQAIIAAAGIASALALQFPEHLVPAPAALRLVRDATFPLPGASGPCLLGNRCGSRSGAVVLCQKQAPIRLIKFTPGCHISSVIK